MCVKLFSIQFQKKPTLAAGIADLERVRANSISVNPNLGGDVVIVERFRRDMHDKVLVVRDAEGVAEVLM